ncbi:valine--tRNA ligase [Candidatus Poriferisodalis sp.]|uniref:valine--tRNA ligase n=1 Tax=Candidatus Poriferisodalis sp. TaxID=3101277 RepID=UPI003B01CE7F
MTQVPDKPTVDGLEAKWSQRWEDDGVYRFDRTAPRERVFSIDTPPPTVSGSLHMGHVFSYTHTDHIARYRRMAGDEVFYPMGWDDNGLPTERRVQNYFGVRCDPALGYDPDFVPPPDGGDPEAVGSRGEIAISRRNFIELCHVLTAEDELAFEALWRQLGLSVDWSMTYATIDERCQRVAQRAFLENLARGEAYQIEAPSLWDVTFGTAVAQAELEDRERPGAYHRIAFGRVDSQGAQNGPNLSSTVEIETTRPELLAACVALVAHPGDERYQPLFGTTVTTPLFGVEVPVVAHKLAEPDKGTGIAMICTFGDTADVTWWRELNLPVRAIVDRRGRIAADPPPGIEGDGPREAYRYLAGRTVGGARNATVELLRESGDLIGEPRPITHAVKFFEKGDRPLEIVSSRQWYIRNGGRDQDLRDALIARGSEMTWHPLYMQGRYTNWIEGLTGDWLISRQRYFGVPIPLWYPLDDAGEPVWDQPITPDDGTLPVDPSADVPTGYDDTQRGRPNGFVGDHDVMDTWATSSLTPQIACGWSEDPDLWERTYPMDMRPQGHDIIRTWLFSTAVRSHLGHDCAPWRHCALSGWILDPDRKKMSKSKGNVVTPVDLLDTYGADAVRYWAANGRPGTDTAFDEGQMKIGRRLAIKLLNAAKFALALDGSTATGDEARRMKAAVLATLSTRNPDGLLLLGTHVRNSIDTALLVELSRLARTATEALEGFDYARALERTEQFFWRFTDDYVELAKGRAYGSQGPEAAADAHLTLTVTLDALLRLFAPFLPFVTEEIWSWWRRGSVHKAPWPSAEHIHSLAEPVQSHTDALHLTAAVLAEVRRAKTEARLSLRVEAEQVTVSAHRSDVEVLETTRADLIDAGRIANLSLVADEAPAHPEVSVVLAADAC